MRKAVSTKTRSTPTSFSFRGQAIKHTTVKWSIVILIFFIFMCLLTKIMHQGVIGADLSSLLNENKSLTSRMAVICGTSSCHMAVSIKLNYGH